MATRANERCSTQLHKSMLDRAGFQAMVFFIGECRIAAAISGTSGVLTGTRHHSCRHRMELFNRLAVSLAEEGPNPVRF